MAGKTKRHLSPSLSPNCVGGEGVKGNGRLFAPLLIGGGYRPGGLTDAGGKVGGAEEPDDGRGAQHEKGAEQAGHKTHLLLMG